MRLAALALLAATLAAPGPAGSEPVLLSAGPRFGLGWKFLDFDGTCRVATPRHVLEHEDGRLRAPDMIERTGRRTATANPAAPADDTIDLAFLETSRIVSDAGCSESRLSGRSLGRVLERMDEGILLIASDVDQQAIRVERVVAARDAFGGAIVAVKPVDPAENLREGMSGGTVIVDGSPFAMLYHVVDEGIGLAYRFDYIATAKAAAMNASGPAPAQPGAPVVEFALQQGTLESGTIADLRVQGSPVELAAEKRGVVLNATLPETGPISEVSLTGPDGSGLGVERIIVEAGAAGGSLAFVTACRSDPGSASIACPFAPRILGALRLTLIPPAGPGLLRIDRISLD